MTSIEILFWVLAFLVFYTFFGYGILLGVLVKIKKALHPQPVAQLPQDLPDVTLLIAAWNEEDMVNDKMANCNALDYPSEHLKVMWVTDGSTDRTNERLAQHLPASHILFQPLRQGKTAALNRAIDFVTTPLLVFSDANTMLNDQCIKEIVKCFTNPKVGCVSGEKRILTSGSDGAAAEGEGFYWRYESQLKAWDSELYSTMGAAGELFAVRTPLFEKMETDTLLDDFILSMRIVDKGYTIAYCRTAYAMETGSASINDEETRKVRISAGGLQSIWRLRRLLNPFHQPIVTFQYVSHRVLRWSITPFALLSLLPLNLWLVWQQAGIIYTVTLILQCIFYITGLAGKALSGREHAVKVLNIPYYFLFMNLNVFKGINYLHKKRKQRQQALKEGKEDVSGAWERARRATK